MHETNGQRTDFRDRISIDPKVLVGKPVIRGTRISVSMILNLVADGISFDEIVADHPSLSIEDIRAAIEYAGARLDREQILTHTTQ